MITAGGNMHDVNFFYNKHKIMKLICILGWVLNPQNKMDGPY